MTGLGFQNIWVVIKCEVAHKFPQGPRLTFPYSHRDVAFPQDHVASEVPETHHTRPMFALTSLKEPFDSFLKQEYSILRIWSFWQEFSYFVEARAGSGLKSQEAKEISAIWFTNEATHGCVLTDL